MEYRFKHSYSTVLQELRDRLHEPAPGRVQLLTGPRQVGKTTLLLELAAEFGPQAVYAAADAPEASLSGWWETQWRNAEALASDKQAVIFLDEIQYISDWSRLLKSRVDEVRRRNLPLHVVVTGSSALQLGSGARETMAGRFERLRLLHWSASELARVFEMESDDAVRRLLRFGSYPGAVPLLPNPDRWKDYVRTSIMEPAIGRDMLATESIRRPALLRQLFAVCVGHPAEIFSLQKLCGQLAERGALETIAHYLHMLEEACLVAGVHKYSGSALRRRSSPPKLVVLNQALLAVFAHDPADTVENREPESMGRWVENACMAHAWNAGQSLHYWRAEPLEVDFVMEGSWGKWAVEVKTGPYTARDLAGLLEFCRIQPRFRPLVICQAEHADPAGRLGVQTRTVNQFLLEGIEISGSHATA